jgi:hypothetical protein
MITPKEAFNILNEGKDSTNLKEFLNVATAREIEEFLRLCKNLAFTINHDWLPLAKTAFERRLSEDAVESTKQLIKHTEKLTNQTDVMIVESKKLGRLTWALIFLTVGLLVLTAALLYIDWHRETTPQNAISFH